MHYQPRGNRRGATAEVLLRHLHLNCERRRSSSQLGEHGSGVWRPRSRAIAFDAICHGHGAMPPPGAARPSVHTPCAMASASAAADSVTAEVACGGREHPGRSHLTLYYGHAAGRHPSIRPTAMASIPPWRRAQAQQQLTRRPRKWHGSYGRDPWRSPLAPFAMAMAPAMARAAPVHPP